MHSSVLVKFAICCWLSAYQIAVQVQESWELEKAFKLKKKYSFPAKNFRKIYIVGRRGRMMGEKSGGKKDQWQRSECEIEMAEE